MVELTDQDMTIIYEPGNPPLRSDFAIYSTSIDYIIKYTKNQLRRTRNSLRPAGVTVAARAGNDQNHNEEDTGDEIEDHIVDRLHYN